MKNSISMTLQELAERLGAKVQGDGSIPIHAVAPLSTAGEGEITFVMNAKYMKSLADTKASAVLLAAPPPIELGKALLLHPNPYACFARLLAIFHPAPRYENGIQPGAFVDSSAHVDPSSCVMPGATVSANAKVGARTVLFPGVYLGADAVIGDDCILYPNAVVMNECVLGQRVILQPGAVVGGDGFGFAPDKGAYVKIPQVGNVVLEDDVEIGANTTVDRSVMGTTRVGRGTKLDNLVMVAHNCQVGEHTVIVSQVGISGSTEIGDHCVIGGQVGVAGHLTIGDNVTLAARSGVMADIPEAGVYWGSPSEPMKDAMKCAAAYRELPEMVKRLRKMEKALEQLDPVFKESNIKKEKS